MGTTPGGLPYPEPTDAIAAGADAIKALALALDPLLKPVWKPITLNGGFVAQASVFAPAYAVLGDRVLLRGGFSNQTGGTLTSSQSCATLPTEARPTAQVNYTSKISGNDYVTRVSVSNSGVLTVWANAGSSWPNTQWVTIDGILYYKT